MVSLVGLRGHHTSRAASSDSGRIICNRRTVFVSVSLSLGGQTDNFYHNAPLYSLSVGKRIICSVSITTLHQTATLAAFPMSKPLNSVHTDIRSISKKLGLNVANRNKTQCRLCKRLAGPIIPVFWSSMVWKRVWPWMWSLEGSQQPFSCVLGHFRHGHEQPTGWS